jgi:uncharacterized protein (TIGR03067 family)
MRSTSAAVLAALLAAAIGCGGKGGSASDPGTPGPAPNTSGPPNLDGTYTLTRAVFGPVEVKPEDLAKAPEVERTVVIKGDKMTLGVFMGQPETWTIKLDAGKNPHEINVTEVKAGKPDDLPGIYRVEGDVVTIHLGMYKAKERPKAFDLTGDSFFLVLKKR